MTLGGVGEGKFRETQGETERLERKGGYWWGFQWGEKKRFEFSGRKRNVKKKKVVGGRDWGF